MLDGVMLLWFLLTAASVLFVAIDIRSTPELLALKWRFVLLTFRYICLSGTTVITKLAGGARARSFRTEPVS